MNRSTRRKMEMLESLLKAYDLMMEGVSSEEFAISGLFAAWMQQVASALLITGMEFERRVWEDVSKIRVSLHERTAFDAYGIGMRAVLLGMLYNVEREAKDEP